MPNPDDEDPDENSADRSTARLAGLALILLLAVLGLFLVQKLRSESASRIASCRDAATARPSASRAAEAPRRRRRVRPNSRKRFHHGDTESTEREKIFSSSLLCVLRVSVVKIFP